MTTQATACGKVILVGEHAVVYGQPAVAVPVTDVRAHVTVEKTPPGTGIEILAHDLGMICVLAKDRPSESSEPLVSTVLNTLQHYSVDPSDVSCRLHIRSDVPVARGMGSGTAVSTALVRGLAAHLGRMLDAPTVSSLVYQTEILLHGTPSGIDNTVVAYERPVSFVKGQPPETFLVGGPVTLVIGDTGVRSETRSAVAMVREKHDQEPERFQDLFVEIGGIAENARQALVHGDVRCLGALMDQNQALLEKLGVSSPALDRLIEPARSAGALGAKLSGGGMGGCMIALCQPDMCEAVASALRNAGAAAVFTTTVAGGE